MPIGSIITGVTGAVSLFDGLLNRSRSNRTSDAAERAIDAQLEQAERVNSLYDEGGEDLSAAIDDFISRFGDAGFFNPGRIDDISSELIRQRGIERGQVEDAVTGGADRAWRSTNGDLARLAQLTSVMAPTTASRVGVPDVDVSFREADYDAAISSLAEQYQRVFDRNTRDQLAGMLSEVDNAGIRSGMEISSANLEAEQRARQMASDELDANSIRALESAISTLGGRQGLAAGRQAGAMTELGGELNEAEFARALAAMSHSQNLEGLTTVQGLTTNGLNQYWGNRTNALGEYAGINAARPEDVLSTYASALGLEGNLAGLRSGGLQEMTTLATAVPSYRATGANAAGTLAGGAGRTALVGSNLFNTQARTDLSAVGGAIDKLFKDVDWNNVLNLGGGSSTPSFTMGFDGSNPSAWNAY